jgi:hypothetical protein
MRDRSLHLARSFNQSSHLHSISSLARRSFPWSSLNPEGLINAKGLSLISACRVERALPLSLNPPRQRNILLAALRHHKGILRHSYPLFGGVPIFISVAMLVRAITLAAAWFPILSCHLGGFDCRPSPQDLRGACRPATVLTTLD